MTKTFLKKLMQHSMLVAMVLSMGWFAKPSQAILAGTVPLAPGAFTFPGDATGDPAGTLLADQVQPFSITTAVGLMSGSIESAVYREAGGTLDFYYQVSNTSPDGDTVDRQTDSNFAGFLTSVGFRTDGATLTGTTFTSSIIAPDTADRSAAGTVVGFNFGVPGIPFSAGPVLPGESSAVLVISTDATQFMMGTASAIDSGTATVPAYEPARVPEPMSFMLLGSGLLCLGLLRRKNRNA